MKKIIAMLLACVMVLGLFAACGGTDTPDTTEPQVDILHQMLYLSSTLICST